MPTLISGLTITMQWLLPRLMPKQFWNHIWTFFFSWDVSEFLICTCLLLKVLKDFHEIVVRYKELKFNLERIWPHYATSLQAIADITNEFLIVSNYNPLLSFCLLSPLFFTLCLFLELFYFEMFHIACLNCSNVEHLVRHLQDH